MVAECDEEYPSIQQVREGVERISELWNECNDKNQLIEIISKLTNRLPERNLECFIFGRGLSPMSTPFLIPLLDRDGKERSDEKIIDLVIHELLHIFLVTDNRRYWETVREKYSTEEMVCVNHIVLYAMMFVLYKEVFQKQPIDFCRENLPIGYARAIEIVNQTGADLIIKEYRQYQEIK